MSISVEIDPIQILSSESILIVEDSPTQAMLLKQALEERNLKVKVATNGLEALELMKSDLPTVIVSDIEMPIMNGYEFCLKVKQDSNLKDIPLILLTNLTDSMDAIRGIECGADNFITKPCEIDFLLSTLADALQNRRRNREPNSEKKVEFFFRGQKHLLEINKMQVTDLLLSTFASAIQKNAELDKAYRKLHLIHEELERKNIQLEQLNKEKNQFLGMAAHDLRNPLSVTLGFSTILIDRLEKMHDEESLKMLERIKHSSTFMLQLINDLLNVSVIESGIVELRITTFDLVKLLDESILFVAQQAEKKQISIVKKYEVPTLEVSCDHDKVEQILMNLLINAIKFSNLGSTIELFLRLEGANAIVAVKDHGVGIPEKDKANLFQPFSKTGTKGTAGESSTGLGLSIVNKIVAAHRGKIWIESEEGKGSTFFVSIPCRNTEKKQP